MHCTTMQIFSHNPRQWQKTQIVPGEAERFKSLRKRHDIRPVFVHASYLINLASVSDTVLRKSIELLSYELENADTIGAEHVILHTGSAHDQDGKSSRARAARSISQAAGASRYNASLLLENTAGERGDITSSMQALADIIDRCHGDGIGGICVDTCHAFSSGYDLTTDRGVEKLFSEIDMHIGIGRLKLIHVNDSKRPLGAGVDRHEHIGRGFIGHGGFERIFSDRRIAQVPLILETPKRDERDDRRNLRTVSRILAGIGGA